MKFETRDILILPAILFFPIYITGTYFIPTIKESLILVAFTYYLITVACVFTLIKIRE